MLQSISGGGSSTGPALFDDLIVTGFTIGIHIGSKSNQAADVLKFTTLNVAHSNTGILIEGIDGVTIGFENLCGDHCTTFLQFVGDVRYNKNILRINGGGIVDCSTDLRIDNPCHLSVDNWYSEGSVSGNRFLDVSPNPIHGFPIYVRVTNCESYQRKAAPSRLYGAGFYAFLDVHHDAALDIGNINHGDRFQLQTEQCEGLEARYYTPGRGGASVNVTRRQCGTNYADNQSIAADESYVFLAGGAKK